MIQRSWFHVCQSGRYFANEREISNPDSIVDHAVITPEMLTRQFVPVDLVLKGFLEIDGVLSQILSYMDKLSCENYIVLPLTLSFDDYEPDNVLGSHAGVHKVGAAYFEISCLQPEFQGALENKFLALLFHSTDRCVENKAAFRLLLNILKLLESEGITVVTSEGVFQVYFALTLVVGDNLGLHGILGYVEGFTATFPWHICRVNKTLVKKQVVAVGSLLRNKENCAADVLVADGTLTGVNE
ncbi:hypothetical protein FOCC_FOCC015398 [Frankliniella occidentalis]|nr:hypothetical protein FOCC_FOCC015398 [Frankliniella occidentalis]